MNDTGPNKKRSGEFVAAALTRRLAGPQTLAQWHELFPDEASCRQYLAGLRWAGGFECPHCAYAERADVSARWLFRCSACGVVCSPATGTAFDHSPLPLRTWLRGIWEIVRSDKGADPAAIARVMPSAREDLVRAWLMQLRHVYRRRRQDELLRGVVEVAKVPIEVALGSRPESQMASCMIAVAVEVRGGDLAGRTRVQRLSLGTLTSFVQAVVAPGSCVRTDAGPGYHQLRQSGYGHVVSLRPDGASMQHARQVAAILRLWMWSSNAIEQAWLDYYLAEFAFRLDARLQHTVNDRAALFNSILRLTLKQPPRSVSVVA